MGPMLQPNIHEKKTSLDRVELTNEFLQGVRNGGRRPVGPSPGAEAVVILVTVPGDSGFPTIVQFKFGPFGV